MPARYIFDLSAAGAQISIIFPPLALSSDCWISYRNTANSLQANRQFRQFHQLMSGKILNARVYATASLRECNFRAFQIHSRRIGQFRDTFSSKILSCRRYFLIKTAKRMIFIKKVSTNFWSSPNNPGTHCSSASNWTLGLLPSSQHEKSTAV